MVTARSLKGEAMAGKIVFKRFSFQVTAADQGYNKKFELDKNIVLIRGLMLTSDNPAMLYYRGSQKIEASGDELYPEDYESKMLMSGLAVPPDERFVDLGNDVQAGNGEIKIGYKDTSNLLAPFTPYTVSLVVRCEIEE